MSSNNNTDNDNTIQSSKKITRRTLLDYLLFSSIAGFIGAVLYPVARFLKPPAQAEAVETSIKVGKVTEIANNSGKVFPFNNKPAILIKTEAGDLKAFTAVCTHLECTVQYREDMGHIWCACHNGHYDLNGKNIAGPPPRPLQEFQVVVKGEEIFVSKQA